MNERDKDRTNNQVDWERWGGREGEEDSAGREGIMVSFNTYLVSSVVQPTYMSSTVWGLGAPCWTGTTSSKIEKIVCLGACILQTQVQG